MNHLNERIADFVFEEMAGGDMAAARQHLANCADCRREVQAFQHTHAMLKTSPDMDPPRRIVFEVARPAPITALLWRWLAPMAASAAVAMAVVYSTAQHQPAPSVAQPQPATMERVIVQPQPTAEPVDYARLEEWLSNELKKRDAANAKDIQRLRGELAYIENLQRAFYRDTMENASAIQLLAHKSDSQD